MGLFIFFIAEFPFFLSSGYVYFRGVFTGKNNYHLEIFSWQEQLCILNFRTASEAELVLTKKLLANSTGLPRAFANGQAGAYVGKLVGEFVIKP